MSAPTGGWASLVAQTVKNLPAMQETQVQSLSWEDPLEKGMSIHSIILAWRIPWTEKPGGPVCGVAKSRTRGGTNTHIQTPKLTQDHTAVGALARVPIEPGLMSCCPLSLNNNLQSPRSAQRRQDLGTGTELGTDLWFPQAEPTF